MLVSGRQSHRETSGLHSSFQSSQSCTPSPLQPHENVKDLTFCRQNGVALFKLAPFPAAFQNTDFCRGPHFLFRIMGFESWSNCCVSPSWPRVSKWNCERHARQRVILAFSPACRSAVNIRRGAPLYHDCFANLHVSSICAFLLAMKFWRDP